MNFDVLCVGHASYDLVFSVVRDPGPDEKIFADSLLECGGGPASNAAVCAARLGFRSAYCGFLGTDSYGESHLRELKSHGVDTSLLVRGESPTPLSVVLVKPDGKRSLVNFKGETRALANGSVDYSGVSAKVILFDGHEPHISMDVLNHPASKSAQSVLDAGSLHAGSLALLDKVDYLVCSEKFALHYAPDETMALAVLAQQSPVVVVTLGERGLIWKRGAESGALPAFPILAIDSTGAGDAFHGAFAAGLAADMEWIELLRYASAAGAYCCTQLGARPGMPDYNQLISLWQTN
jgi:sulfofructose kinase